MTIEKKLVAPKRRTRAEVQQFVAEFVSSSMRRSEFCRSRGLSFGTLDRHLKKQCWKTKKKLPATPSHFRSGLFSITIVKGREETKKRLTNGEKLLAWSG